MGFVVALSTTSNELLERYEESQNVLMRLLPGVEDETFPALRWLDPFIDTTFNEVQVLYLVQDLERRLGQLDLPAGDRAVVADVLDLARKAAQPRRRLTFFCS